ncbi:MAG TPA: phasin family protein [Burkholderiales bacterium]|nr:phasin family protein [Burkholderiales bacterium]
MLSQFEHLNVIGKTNLNAAQKFAAVSAELTERLIKAQMEAVKEILNSNNEHLQSLWSKPATAASAAYWQGLYQTNAEKAQQITRNYFTQVSKIQEEMARLMEEQTIAMNKKVIKDFEDLAKYAIEDSTKVAKATKSPSQAKRSA